MSILREKLPDGTIIGYFDEQMFTQNDWAELFNVGAVTVQQKIHQAKAEVIEVSMGRRRSPKRLTPVADFPLL